MKRIAILQSNYIPWKGYFDLINCVDEFVVYDTAQYTKNDWRNRNKIKTPQGLTWLTIPVRQPSLSTSILEVTVSDMSWPQKHWRSICQNYSKSLYFKLYENTFRDFYLANSVTSLSEINVRLIEIVNSVLGIKTKISWSSDYELVEGRTEKLLSICKQAGADIYLSGPAAKQYFDQALADKMGISVEWMEYSGYPEYRQLYPPFEHGVSILDLIFNEGPRAVTFMKTFRNANKF